MELFNYLGSGMLLVLIAMILVWLFNAKKVNIIQVVGMVFLLLVFGLLMGRTL